MIINGDKYNVVINRRAGQKNTYLRIKGNDIVVSTNTRVSDANLNAFVLSNKEYIVNSINSRPVILDNEIYLLGVKYEKIDSDTFSIKDGIIYYEKNGFYEYAKEVLTKMFFEIHEKFDLGFTSGLKFKRMKSKYGMCNITEKEITLNILLIHYKKEHIRYVIYHEFCHYYEPSHKKEYWAEVVKYVPNYKDVRAEMRDSLYVNYK